MRGRKEGDEGAVLHFSIFQCLTQTEINVLNLPHKLLIQVFLLEDSFFGKMDKTKVWSALFVL